MVGEQWKNAPSSVVESVQQSLAVSGSESGECVTVWGGEMVTAECSEEHRYVCVFNYPGENSYCDCPCETVHGLLLPTNACLSMYTHTACIVAYDCMLCVQDMPKVELWVCSLCFTLSLRNSV